MTSRRPLAIALAASAFYAGVFVTAAHAEMHYVRVTLVTGQQLTITVEVPPGTPVEQVQIPGLPAAVASIVDLGSTETHADAHRDEAPTVTATPDADRHRDADPRRPRPAHRSDGTGKTKDKGKDEADQDQEPSEKTDDAANKRRRRRQHGVADGQGRGGEADPTPGRRPPTAGRSRPPQNDPTYSLAEPGAAKIGVPNFFIDRFRIPPFLLPIYQAAGTQYGIRWELLAAINEIETDYGRNANVSSAGAQGWMQFMPATWKAYGVDGNEDGLMDPYNPVDAIFAAARYLKAAGADKDIRGAVFAYNHADWYVDCVLLRAQVIGGLPANLVGSLTGLTEGRFPVAAKATYADEVTQAQPEGQAPIARPARAAPNRRGISIYADAGSPVIAVSDARVIKIGVSKRLGNFVQVQDAYGNTYTYGRLAKVSKLYAAPKPQKVDPAEVKRMLAAAQARQDAEGRGLGHRPARLARRDKKAVERDGRRRPSAAIEEPAPPSRRSRSACSRTRRAQRHGRRRRPAGVPAHGPHRRRAHAGARARPRARPDRHQEAQGRLAGARRHRARPHRPRVLGQASRTCASRSARPAAAPRASTRSRSSTAGSCSSRPRSTAPRARTRSSARTPRRPRSARSC